MDVKRREFVCFKEIIDKCTLFYIAIDKMDII